jgi:hypothetical protein
MTISYTAVDSDLRSVNVVDLKSLIVNLFPGICNVGGFASTTGSSNTCAGSVVLRENELNARWCTGLGDGGNEVLLSIMPVLNDNISHFRVVCHGPVVPQPTLEIVNNDEIKVTLLTVDFIVLSFNLTNAGGSYSFRKHLDVWTVGDLPKEMPISCSAIDSTSLVVVFQSGQVSLLTLNLTEEGLQRGNVVNRSSRLIYYRSDSTTFWKIPLNILGRLPTPNTCTHLCSIWSWSSLIITCAFGILNVELV